MKFGNHAPARLKDSYDFLPLMQNGVGAITGIFYDGLDPQARVIPVFGVTCNGGQYGTQSLKAEP